MINKYSDREIKFIRDNYYRYTHREISEDMVEIIDTQPILEYLAQINLIQKGLKGKIQITNTN